MKGDPAPGFVPPDFDRLERLDHFAEAALTGLLINAGSAGAGSMPSTTAVWAWDYAEAMEAERARRLA
jgi:hypothetical protein